ncbi:carboxypeptidase-like regulatory domain-containing protein [Roseisolibacter agri]|uniref:Carboxypeptidase regulatory-like domain-containing protein n=1 Tax=Roseisolibacter agri TaxID=2014610 RepID=A0AA37V147_9BACT|nr:carboxypeptidase-like regulatory domain-containing protein [Roseisolibacter agri]GLC25615.1 hypothetical protein rosag_21280 [Roseisolibacter agri]
MPRRTPVLPFLLAALLGGASPALAQAPAGPPEVVRGRVTDDSARAVFAAAITVTRGPDRLVQTTTTDSAGRYSVRFDPGTGDYLVHVAAPGFRPARRRVERQGAERELVADFALGRDLAMLAAVQIRGERPVRASNPIRPTTLETGAAEKWVDGVGGQLPPSVAGDLSALAGTIPGVTLTPSGPAILGSGAESNLTTLNGLALPGGSIPRAARTETRVTGATFDPTRGGFSGANIDVRLGPGDRFYQRRNGFLTLDAPQLQFTDAVGRASGAANGGFRGSLGADGELIRQALTYNVALDIARNTSDPATLVNAQAETLLRAGVAPDSVARLVQLTGPLGLPLSGGGIPTARNRDALTWLGRLDDTRDSLKTRTLTSYAGLTKEGALGFGPLTAPSVGGERKERTLGAQLVLADFVGAGRRVLTETRLSASLVGNEATPYRRLPGATVLVRSDIAADGDALDDRSDVAGLTLGGGPFVASDERRWTVEGANETIWNARGRRHRFKALAWMRGDGLRQSAVGNALGNYTFASLDDFAANRPASYTRTLVQPEREGTVWNGAAALAHQWTPSRWFNVLYGARVETSVFGDRPPANPALEQALGVRTGVAPTRFHVSPRAGFSFTYNRDRENGSGTNQNPVGRFYRTTAGVIRGGIGEFRDLLRPGLLADATASTGLPGSTSLLSCVGAAVPAADWSLFASDASTIPTQCAGGGGILAERAPSVTLIDRDYDVPRSWRASLDWNTSWQRLLLRVSALGSYDLSQPGVVDANFAGTQRFALAGEGNRPVFVTPAAIDAGSGAVSASEARRAPQFGRVGVRTSDLRGYGGQLTFQVSPDVFKFRSRASIFSSVAYTLQGTKRQYRGFDGAAFGDPSVREWAAGPNDARHQLVVTGGFSTRKTGTVTLFARAQSGLPYTPVVQGDVNGDGRSGDRAFVPAVANVDAQLAEQLQALLVGGAPGARECLTAYAGRMAARNGCRGPWTQTLNMQWRPPIPRRWASRLTTNVYLQNVLGGIDQLLHDDASLRGWGSTATPDAVLLVPRGFDASAPGGPRFRYDVNPRFGDTRGARTLLREPFRLSIDFSVNLAVDYPVQQLRRALEPVRVPGGGWQRRSADSLAAFYLSRTSNIHRALLAESDSLFLSRAQVAALQRNDSAFSAEVRGMYVALGQFLASRPEGEPGKVELDSVAKVEKAYWKAFWRQPEIADSVVTPTQRELFPMLRNMVATPMKDRENSQWQFGYPVPFDPKANQRPVPRRGD